jgi:tetratricopeptide (TPR) repeat protein
LAKAALAILSPVVFLVLLELVLALVGVAPRTENADPFVGFAGDQPLFMPEVSAGQGEWLETSNGKLELFNYQRFPRHKVEGTFRIFCLGGSTTYGRPYDDATSFPGWLRQILPALDPSRSWEVINAGGISYASYRVANLMEELVAYEPDMFIVYTGHNEFLEERTYANIRDLPLPVKALSSFVAKTRVATAMAGAMEQVGLLHRREAEEKFMMPETVAAKLDKSAGLDLYERDDVLRQQVLDHYQASLERLAATARSAGSALIFVKPASNSRSCSPFKSEHTPGIGPDKEARASELLDAGRQLNRQAAWSEALLSLDEAVALDPRFAGIHYERGRALFSLGRVAEAKSAFLKAREEDVCPLRALSEMEEIVETVARESGAQLVDYVRFLERDLERTQGHTILGEEDFLDHVHPTIAGHRRLAVGLVETMRQQGVLAESARLTPQILERITRRVNEGIDRKKQASALASLAWTLDWAGKRNDSRRLALKALESGFETPRILLIAGKHFALDGDLERAYSLYQRAVRADPLSPTPHYQMGLLAISRGELEKAAAHFSLATILWPYDAKAHEKLGLVMAERGRYPIAVASLTEAKRRDPGRASIDAIIERIELDAGATLRPGAAPQLEVESYPSGIVRTTMQSWPDPTGGSSRLGIRTEWAEDGSLLRFADTVNGSVLGEISWGAAKEPAASSRRMR